MMKVRKVVEALDQRESLERPYVLLPKQKVFRIFVLNLWLQKKAFTTLRNILEKRSNKNVPTDILNELEELVLQNNYFEFNERYLKQIRGTAIGIKFTPPYAVIFVAAS